MGRHEFLNALIDDPSLRRRRRGIAGKVHYLEIGVRRGRTFQKVRAAHKVGVDPHHRPPGETHQTTSDEFFARNTELFDLVFVDGLHLRDQAKRDALNAIRCLRPGGVVVMDDCRPRKECQQQVGSRPENGRPWCGDVWKAVVDLRRRRDVDTCVYDAGWGYGVVLPRPNTQSLPPAGEPLTWDIYRERQRDLLRLVDDRELAAFLQASPVGEAAVLSDPPRAED